MTANLRVVRQLNGPHEPPSRPAVAIEIEWPRRGALVKRSIQRPADDGWFETPMARQDNLSKSFGRISWKYRPWGLTNRHNDSAFIAGNINVC
jgi:hypothetical protein